MRSTPRSDSGQDRIVDYDPERARRTLSGGILLFRWIAFGWMVALNIFRAEAFRHPVLALAALSLTGVWLVWLTLNEGQEGRSALWIDLLLSVGLIVMSMYVARGGLNFATAYPASTALAWGAAGGLSAALEAAAALGVALVLSRPIGGLAFSAFGTNDTLSLVNGLVYFLLAGGATGVVARHLDHSAALLRATLDDAIRSREQAARLAERESLARVIHDSVLQALSRINVLGKEMGARPSVPGSEVLALGEMAGEQERALRALIVREPIEAPAGTAALQEHLERTCRAISAIPVSVSSVGPIWVPTAHAEQVEAAVKQALDNVVEHAGASHAWVFAHIEDGWITVSIRDDGAGFVYDERRLAEEEKAGMLKSMKGRIEDLGGRMWVETAPGAGTVVQFRIPVTMEGVRT